MTRVNRAQVSFHGVAIGQERASAVVQRALGQLAAAPIDSSMAAAQRVQLTVRVPHNASDAVIADRLGIALRRRFGRPTR
jgi:hypothetical protein